MANHRFGLYRSYATINLPASSACNDSTEHWADARAPLCFKVQKSSRTARSRRHGLSFPDRGQVIFPGCAARAALKATLEEGPTERWTIGSNDVATTVRSGLGPMQPARVSHPDLNAITVLLASTATPERGGLAYLDAVLPAEDWLAAIRVVR